MPPTRQEILCALFPSAPFCNRRRYKLSVENGSGSGRYRANTYIPISANPAPSGYRFNRWELISGKGEFEDELAANTTFRIRNIDSEINAVYTLIPVQPVPPIYPPQPTTYSLRVDNGSGSGWYRDGQIVEVSADSPPPGAAFDRWNIVSGGGYFDNSQRTVTSFTMPRANTIIEALYKVAPTNPTPPPIPQPTKTYSLLVESGTGSGDYRAGQIVPITAIDPMVGGTFVRWVIVSGGGYIASPYEKNTTFTMTDLDTIILAEYQIEQPPIQTLPMEITTKPQQEMRVSFKYRK